MTETAAAAAAAAQNITGGDSGRHGAPPNVVESLLPLLGLRGFAPLYGLVGSSLGIDPTNLLTALGLLWALNRLLRQLYHVCYGLVSEHLMSSVHVSSNDDIYLHLMKWLASQSRMVNSRSLTAETVSRTAWEDEDESNVARDQSGRYLNFSNQEARSPPQFVPAIGLHNFWWRGQYFRLHRKRESFLDDAGGGPTFKDKEDLVVSCLWRSPEPIKQLLRHAKEQYYVDHQARTIVKRPGPQNMRRYGGRYSWQIVANRPVRDMRTVVLDQQQKMHVLADINEYLHPSTPRWYANRGIPLRRGYLFHGPPGTGKTSLSFALAGVFGLDIHVISLQEPTLTEEDLGSLFGALPRRCVVLLEDIDSAGLRRPADQIEQAEEEEKAQASSSGSGGGDGKGDGKDDGGNKDGRERGGRGRGRGRSSDWKVSDLAKALKKEGSGDDKKGISLSGLLNAIDGVASHEGRVLIMTTNVPEALDEALIRPGRVDLQVEFAHATRQQAEELFVRMYEADGGGRGTPTIATAAAAAADGPSASGKPAERNGGAVAPEIPRPAGGGDLDVAEDELPSVARRFAQKIPDGQFSPAEIQGYLLKRKKHPLRALREAEEWVEALTQQKASKSKISKVQ
ncbi:hypothetical protein DL766_009862 [Monosporascus sp. MC13-8B]|uniref:BCS1 N-terminal domain-containing protein n=1 Tax=Monosporascus cannonballus TaxID=155416 RepID=A0ABY0H4H8_9PEZI|nr:hypothetical protein DL763_009770 [Monosporascus cannonballus]RYO84610.1 hypothetical protein DL762_005600 [Monosporascus cannonballus]RYP13374.1 hypothetical protein DL766_009862 [Monosporascus sp. MC13-8B]